MKLKYTDHPLYNRFKAIRNRCHNPKYKGWHNYGGKGITICQEWLRSPRTFVQWGINNGYAPELQIDRIDPNGNYEPANCRFVTNTQNARNKANQERFTINGITGCFYELAEHFQPGVKADTLYARVYNLGWTVEQAILTPVREWKPRK